MGCIVHSSGHAATRPCQLVIAGTATLQIISLTGWEYIMYRSMHNTSPFAVIYYVLLIFLIGYIMVRNAGHACSSIACQRICLVCSCLPACPPVSMYVNFPCIVSTSTDSSSWAWGCWQHAMCAGLLHAFPSFALPESLTQTA